MDLPIEVCNRCGVRAPVCHIRGVAICPDHLSHRELAEDHERLRLENISLKDCMARRLPTIDEILTKKGRPCSSP